MERGKAEGGGARRGRRRTQASKTDLTRAVSRAEARCKRRWRRRWRYSWFTCCHASSQRSLQTAVRKASMGFTWVGPQRMPAPLSRACITTLLPLSTMPEPMGHPAAR